jgi:hypothetical protein
MDLSIFYDIDGVLKKFGQKIPETTSGLLYDLHALGISQNISTGRAYSQTQEALKESGINERVFRNMVVENGFWLVTPDGEYCPILIRNPQGFEQVKWVLGGRGFEGSLAENGYTLFRGGRIERVNGVCYSFDYGDIKPTGEIPLARDMKPVYFLGNLVRVTVKTPVLSADESEGYRDHETIMGLMRERVGLSGLSDACLMNFNPQGTDVSPIHTGEEYPKNVGIRNVLEVDDEHKKGTVVYCGDSRNDISAMEFLAERYRGQRGKCLLVGPSNSSNEVKSLLRSEDGVVLEEDASGFGVGFRRFLAQEGLI